MECLGRGVTHRGRNHKRLTLLVVATAFVLSACQGATAVLTEQILEQVDGVDTVEVDVDTEEIKIETDEGSISIGGGEIPHGFAAPVPNGGDAITVFASPGGSTVTLCCPIDRYDELVTCYTNWTAS